MRLDLSVEEADALYALLDDLLENDTAPPVLGRPHRLLAWRTLAAGGGTGLTGRLAAIARESPTLEEFESRRARELGPILEGLERAENRDP